MLISDLTLLNRALGLFNLSRIPYLTPIKLVGLLKLRFQHTNGRKLLGLLDEQALFELRLISSKVHRRAFLHVVLSLPSHVLLVLLA